MLLIATTLVSLTIALAMSIVAWRVTREERWRSETRVQTLAADIENGGESRFSPASGKTIADPVFAFAAPAARAGSRMAAIIAIGALVVVASVTVAVFGSNSSHPAPAAAVAPPAQAPQVPLELVALSHERDGDRLTVRGIVRNPRGAAAVDHLTAVVFVFDRNGGFVASGRAAIEPGSLPSSAESGFVVTVPGVADVGRYRVSFRTEDRVVPHVDRRIIEGRR